MSFAIDAMRRAEFGFLTLDFGREDVTYFGTQLPTGTLACDVLNIPQETMDKLCELTEPMMRFVDTLQSGKVDLFGLEQSRRNVYLALELLTPVPPFSYMDTDVIRAMLDRQFASENLKRVRRNLEKREDKYALKFIQALSLVAQLGFSLTSFREVITRLADELNDDAQPRTPEGYANVFREFFPLGEASESTWMSLANVSMQYLVTGEPARLVRRMHYISFAGMFRSDLFEGLCAGHAPRKCAVCGRWFLTTDARHTKYCGGFAPGDKKGRTCRQVGNLVGRDRRELADDHPLKKIYTRRMNTVDQCLRRGTLDSELASVMKRLAKDKMLRAISDATYAKESYETEMEQATLMAEAKKLL